MSNDAGDSSMPSASNDEGNNSNKIIAEHLISQKAENVAVDSRTKDGPKSESESESESKNEIKTTSEAVSANDSDSQEIKETVSKDKADKDYDDEKEEEGEEEEEQEKKHKTQELSLSIKNNKNTDKSNVPDDYLEHITYTEDGQAIYTDPKTKYKYEWSIEKNNWIPMDNTEAATAAQNEKNEMTGNEESVSYENAKNPYENEHYKWCPKTQKWLLKTTALTADGSVTETEHYKWDPVKKEWIAKVKQKPDNDEAGTTPRNYVVDENGQRTYRDKDGVVFFWDSTKSAWFPKIDDDFMARYQMNYGFIDNTTPTTTITTTTTTTKATDEAARNEQNQTEGSQLSANWANQVDESTGRPRQNQTKWFDLDPAHNTKVYVSNLPLDITTEEFVELMSKCGLVMRDPQTQKYKVKLYAEADGQIKGDGLCDYIKVESVDLALKILDDYIYRGNKIHVQRAQFQMRGEYNPALKPKKSKKKDKEKLQKIKEKLFDWRPEKLFGERSKNERIVIIKNLFTPEIFAKEVQLILDYQNDLREECTKCGTVRKVVIYDRHVEGIAQINMGSPEEADLVIQMMHGRFFGKRQLIAEHWDGKTKYKVEESGKDETERLNNWNAFLEDGEANKSDEPDGGRSSADGVKTNVDQTSDVAAATATAKATLDPAAIDINTDDGNGDGGALELEGSPAKRPKNDS